METQESNAKTPAPSENGNSLKQPDTSGRDVENEKISSAISAQEENQVSNEVKARPEEHATENAGTAGVNVHLPDNGDPEVHANPGNSLSQILEVSRGFMKNLHMLAGKGLPGRRGAHGNPESVAERGKMQVSRRSRDWDTRLFVLSTLKRMVDNEHFEELEEEDSRIQFTREALQIRNKIMAEKDKRQHRKPKVEKLLPIAGMSGKKTVENVVRNTREKLRFEKSRQLQEQRVSARAGIALNDALQKVTYIKDPRLVTEIPEKPEIKNDEVIGENIKEVEPKNEEREQNPQKRGFFNFSVKL